MRRTRAAPDRTPPTTSFPSNDASVRMKGCPRAKIDTAGQEIRKRSAISSESRPQHSSRESASFLILLADAVYLPSRSPRSRVPEQKVDRGVARQTHGRHAHISSGKRYANAPLLSPAKSCRIRRLSTRPGSEFGAVVAPSDEPFQPNAPPQLVTTRAHYAQEPA